MSIAGSGEVSMRMGADGSLSMPMFAKSKWGQGASNFRVWTQRYSTFTYHLRTMIDYFDYIAGLRVGYLVTSSIMHCCRGYFHFVTFEFGVLPIHQTSTCRRSAIYHCNMHNQIKCAFRDTQHCHCSSCSHRRGLSFRLHSTRSVPQLPRAQREGAVIIPVRCPQSLYTYILTELSLSSSLQMKLVFWIQQSLSDLYMIAELCQYEQAAISRFREVQFYVYKLGNVVVPPASPYFIHSQPHILL